METLEKVLCTHAKRYPRMQPTDAVKLVYQNEFGGGHLVRDSEACLRVLRQEYADTPQEPGAPLLEPIGNGVVRVMLNALDGSGYTIEALGDAFLCSSQAHTGNLQRFLGKLDVLRKVTDAEAFAFGPEELETYLEEYRAAGYPAVSHSRQYREAYHPAYRIVQQRKLPAELTAGFKRDTE